MKTLIVKPLLVSLGLLLGSSVAAAGQDMLFACTETDGSVVLGSAATGPNCEQISAPAQESAAAGPALASAAVPAAAKANPVGAKAGGSSGQAQSDSAPGDAAVAAAELPPMEKRLSQYRDTMLQGASGAYGAPAAAANPAVNRRYRATNRAAYMSAH